MDETTTTTPPTDGGRITDELRERIDAVCRVSGWDCKRLTEIADRIDAELAERYVELPKDADGEYIHIGDRMRHRVFPDAKYTVIGIGENAFFTCDASGELYKHIASLYPHYKQPTVEDVLHSFICDVEEDVRDEREIIAEYAAKLRLADDGKEQ